MKLKKGTIVQIDPDSDEVFGGCLLIVTELKKFGVQGYVDVPGKGQAYYRAKEGNYKICGSAEWMVGNGD
jgi:hypothetical protein